MTDYDLTPEQLVLSPTEQLRRCVDELFSDIETRGYSFSMERFVEGDNDRVIRFDKPEEDGTYTINYKNRESDRKFILDGIGIFEPSNDGHPAEDHIAALLLDAIENSTSEPTASHKPVPKMKSFGKTALKSRSLFRLTK